MGKYHFNCPLDQHFVNFAGIDAEALKVELAKGKGDGEILEWINAHATAKPRPWEIAVWSNYHDTRGPSDVETREFFQWLSRQAQQDARGHHRLFDVLDLDDHVSFGGKA